jgi:hypothetical protein
MPREKSLARCIDRITARRTTSTFDDHESLGADHVLAPEAYAISLDVGSLSVMSLR